MNISQRAIVLIEVPYSDYSSKKVRPAIVLSNERIKTSKDIIVVPLTSNLTLDDPVSFIIKNDDLEEGTLIVSSRVKVERIFSVDKRLIKKTIGKVKQDVHQRIIKNLNRVIQ